RPGIVIPSHLPLVVVGLMLIGAFPSFADVFDTMRLQWRDLLAGGTNYNTQDVNIQHALVSIPTNANYLHTNFWNNLPDANDSAQMTVSFNRIYSMALAYATRGSGLQGDPGLGA